MGHKRVLMHLNHGVIVCGETVAEAFDALYYLERACKLLVTALSTGRKLRLIDDKVQAFGIVDFNGLLHL